MSSTSSVAAQRDDWLTAGAVGLLAMMVVTCDHEVLGHGGASLLLHGNVLYISSSVFRSQFHSGWIDAGGPMMNILGGLVALFAGRWVTPTHRKTLLFLLLVTAFSFFWEGGYLIHAMHRRDGDLYFFARYLLGDVTVAERCVFAALGVAIYLTAVRLTSRALGRFATSLPSARVVARSAWVAAALGSAAAAAASLDMGGFRDGVLQIGLASFPLLIIPRRQPALPVPSPEPMKRSLAAVSLSLIVFAVFVATWGRGIRF